jgi:uncharacterized protein
MRDMTGPLSEAESLELGELLENHAGRTVAFARGVFAAVATAPTRRDPTEWLPLLLAEEPPDRATLRRLFSLVLREHAACAECLELGVPAVPSSDEADAIVQFCKGYVRVSQGDPRWTKDAGAFELTVPLAFLAGYVDVDAVKSFAPDAGEDPEAYRTSRSEQLADDVARLYAYWAEARKEPPPPAQSSKIGRNEPCPCGSGKKFKNCCGA